jgi:23S rRNA (cytosine1962-C5)-methyltransferase
MDKLILKPGKEKPIRNCHPWIFSGAVKKMPQRENGSLVQVESSEGALLGTAYFNRKTSIVGRMVAFGSAPPAEVLKKSIRNAIHLRISFFGKDTTGYRLINAEGDFLPGLIVDRYGDCFVLQIGTLGMEKLKSLVIQEFIETLNPQSIYEKSLSASRREEGLAPQENLLYGSHPETIEVLENGLKFLVNPSKGQKTGFFLDQREMRLFVRGLSQQKQVLNCFAYSGGFTVYALAGGAQSVDSVDISQDALELAKANCLLNDFEEGKTRFFREDVFEFLRARPLNYQVVILDPPAFAKHAKDVVRACRGYKDLNRIALQKMPAQSLLITCSCSHFIDEKLFQQVLFQAAVEAGRKVQIIGRHRQALDHPVSLFHPEGSYLKSFVLFVQ